MQLLYGDYIKHIGIAIWLNYFVVIILCMNYRRIDDDRGKSYELGQSTVKCMRGILGKCINNLIFYLNCVFYVFLRMLD